MEQAGTQNFTVNAADNYWQVPTAQIAGRIRDCTFDDNACNTASSTLGKVAYTPALAEPEPDAPAFVRSATLNPNPVGQQRGVVTVDFSRPMVTTTLPTAIFHDARRGTTEKMLDQPVQAMAQDVIGRLWFAGDWNNPGVKMYDGQRLNSVQGITGTITAIYGASNGDVWFAHPEMADINQLRLSRLQGTTWITYTSNQITPTGWIAELTAINEDLSGNLWFGSSNGAWRYDGVHWKHFTTADGLADNYVQQIVSDGQGRVWFRAGMGGIGSPGGLSVFDGVNWKIYGESDGLPPPMYLQTIFADSQGRIWASAYNMVDSNTAKVWPCTTAVVGHSLA